MGVRAIYIVTGNNPGLNAACRHFGYAPLENYNPRVGKKKRVVSDGYGNDYFTIEYEEVDYE